MNSRILQFISIFFLISFNIYGETITLAATEWFPYYSENLPQKGIVAEIAEEALKRSGYKLEIVFVPWKRALEVAGQGGYDGILGAFYSEDRDQLFQYSVPYFESRIVFISKSSADISWLKLSDLRDLTIGAANGSVQLEEIREFGLKTEVTNQEIQSLQKLHAGRVDLLLLDDKGFASLVNSRKAENKKLFRKDFKILKPAYKKFNIHTLLSRKRNDADIIIEKFNASLLKMENDGTLEKIKSRYNITEDH